jgi:hypothetical protein
MLISLDLLAAYDHKNGTHLASDQGVKVLAGLLPRASSGYYSNYFNHVGRIVLESKDPEAIRKFFDAVDKSPSSEGLVRDPNSVHFLRPMIDKLKDKTQNRVAPDPDQVERVFKRCVEYYEGMGAHSRDFHQSYERLWAQGFAELAVDYFSSVAPSKAQVFADDVKRIKEDIERIRNSPVDFRARLR